MGIPLLPPPPLCLIVWIFFYCGFFQAELENQRKLNSSKLEKSKVENEKNLLELADVYKSKLVNEYQKFDQLQEETTDLKGKKLIDLYFGAVYFSASVGLNI